jgi:hypothetical protein
MGLDSFMVVVKQIGEIVLLSTLAIVAWTCSVRAIARDGRGGLRRIIIISHAFAFPTIVLFAAGFWSCTVYIAGAEATARLVHSNLSMLVPLVTAGWLDLAGLIGLGAASRRAHVKPPSLKNPSDV